MTARTYSAAEMRKAYMEGYRDGQRTPKSFGDVADFALARWPDPPPEPPALTVREELDPRIPSIRWRWRAEALEVFVGELWGAAHGAWFASPCATPARLALWADLAAHPMRLPDGRPCTLTGEAKP